jgi:hypothetical protein
MEKEEYRILVYPEKDHILATMLAWCIQKLDEQYVWQDVENGYSDTPEEAFQDALKEYNKLREKEW